MTALAGAIASGSLGSLIHLDLEQNQVGDEGMAALSTAIASGSLPALKEVVVQSGHEDHTQLVAACEPRGIVILNWSYIA